MSRSASMSKMQKLKHILKNLPMEELKQVFSIMIQHSSLSVDDLKQTARRLDDCIMTETVIDVTEDKEEMTAIETRNCEAPRKRKIEASEGSSKRQKTIQKYSIEYFASDNWKIWNFISKGPQVVFTLFDKDQIVLDWFKSKTEERNTFFYMCTRSLHTEYNFVRPVFDEAGNEKQFFDRNDYYNRVKSKIFSKKKKRDWIKKNVIEWDCESLKRLVSQYGFPYKDNVLKNFQLCNNPSRHCMDFARDVLGEEERKDIVEGKRRKYSCQSSKGEFEELFRNELFPEMRKSFTKQQAKDKLLEYLNVVKELTIYDKLVNDAKKYNVVLNSHVVERVGVDRMHRWYQDCMNLRYTNVSFNPENSKKRMIEDVLNSSDATKKKAYESLEEIINKKKDVGKAAFRELKEANFIGEEILLGVYEHSDDAPVAGVITAVTEDWLKYKPYKLDEVIKTTTKKVYGKDKEVQVKFWNKKQFGKERMLKKFRGNAPYGKSYFDVRAKENNMKKFNFVPADNGFSCMFKTVDKKVVGITSLKY